MAICSVADCLAVVITGRTCPLHARATLAKHVGGLAATPSGRGGQRCAKCRRIVREEEWVWKQPVQMGPPPRYQHVDCAPLVDRETRDRKRKSLKPLLCCNPRS